MPLCATCSVCVQLIRVIKLSGQSESNVKATAIQSARGGESSVSRPANSDAEGLQEDRSNYTVIDTIYDEYCEGCLSQERAERSAAPTTVKAWTLQVLSYLCVLCVCVPLALYTHCQCSGVLCVLCVPPSLPCLCRVVSIPLVVPSSGSSLQTSTKGAFVSVSDAVCSGVGHSIDLGCAHLHFIPTQSLSLRSTYVCVYTCTASHTHADILFTATVTVDYCQALSLVQL